MKVKITTPDVIETTKYMISTSEEPAAIIEGVCKTHRITNDFIKEFRQYITKEMFMSSYRLSKELADSYYGDLYDPDAFKENCKLKTEEIKMDPNQALGKKLNNMTNSIQMMFNQNGCNSSTGNFITGAQLSQLSNMFGGAPGQDEEETITITTNNLENISISMLSEFFSDFYDKSEYELTEDIVLCILREATTEEIESSDVLNLMGISNEIDQLILKRIKDQDTKDQILLALSVSDDHEMTSSTYKYLGNDMKEDLIGTEDVSIKEFLNSLSESPDLGWKIKMINSAVNGDLKFEKTTATFDKELVMLMANLPESEIVKLTKIANYMPNTFSYKAVSWMLQNKEFDENELIEMKDVIKKSGNWFALMKIAKENNYENLKNSMKN